LLYVNLIEDRLQQRRLSDRVMVGGILLCLALLVGTVAMVVSFKAIISGLNRDIKRIESETEQIKPEADAARREQETIDILKPVLALAEEVHSTHERWGLILSGIAEQLPPDVGLVEVSSSTDPATGARRLKVRGEARDQQVVSEYIFRLNNFKPGGYQVFDPTRTTLGDISTQELGGRRVTNFTLDLVVAGTEKPKAPASEAEKKGAGASKEGAK